jgi:hypothetical protein
MIIPKYQNGIENLLSIQLFTSPDVASCIKLSNGFESAKSFQDIILLGRVRELLINSEKASTFILFDKNVERVLCIRFQ